MAERNYVVGLEGIDGSGKTTAGKIMAQETGARYFYSIVQKHTKIS